MAIFTNRFLLQIILAKLSPSALILLRLIDHWFDENSLTQLFMSEQPASIQYQQKLVSLGTSIICPPQLWSQLLFTYLKKPHLNLFERIHILLIIAKKEKVTLSFVHKKKLEEALTLALNQSDTCTQSRFDQIVLLLKQQANPSSFTEEEMNDNQPVALHYPNQTTSFSKSINLFSEMKHLFLNSLTVIKEIELNEISPRNIMAFMLAPLYFILTRYTDNQINQREKKTQEILNPTVLDLTKQKNTLFLINCLNEHEINLPLERQLQRIIPHLDMTNKQKIMPMLMRRLCYRFDTFLHQDALKTLLILLPDFDQSRLKITKVIFQSYLNNDCVHYRLIAAQGLINLFDQLNDDKPFIMNQLFNLIHDKDIKVRRMVLSFLCATKAKPSITHMDKIAQLIQEELSNRLGEIELAYAALKILTPQLSQQWFNYFIDHSLSIFISDDHIKLDKARDYIAYLIFTQKKATFSVKNNLEYVLFSNIELWYEQIQKTLDKTKQAKQTFNFFKEKKKLIGNLDDHQGMHTRISFCRPTYTNNDRG